MEEQNNEMDSTKALIREAIDEYLKKEQTKAEPGYKVELVEERKKREQLERRLNELIEENKRTRKAAEEAERQATIRAELQRLGVQKVDLAFRACKDDIVRAEDGRLVARSEQGEVGLKEYLGRFVSENPEFLPARIAGGSGASGTYRAPAASAPVDLDKIKPGMSGEEAERLRAEIAKIAAQTLRGF